MGKLFLISDGFGPRVGVEAVNLEEVAKTLGGFVSGKHILVHRKKFKVKPEEPRLSNFLNYVKDRQIIGRYDTNDPREYVSFNVTELPLFKPRRL